jgi:META domain
MRLKPMRLKLMRLACLLSFLVLAGATWPAGAAEPFPFGTELALDAKPAAGSKRLPMIQIEDDGTAAIDLWCGSVRAQVAVGDDGTIAITLGARDNAQCTPDRIAGDDDLLDMLVHMTNWRHQGDAIELSGAATLRFHQMTN